jgi:hypothetical protein
MDAKREMTTKFNSDNIFNGHDLKDFYDYR